MGNARSLIESVLSGLPVREAISVLPEPPKPKDGQGKPIQNTSNTNILVLDWILMFGLSIAQRCVLDGYKTVYASIWGPESASPFTDFLGKGCGVELAPEGWMNYLDWADVVAVTGSEHRGHVVKFFQEHNIPVVGPDQEAVKLELDREFGLKVAQAAGIYTPWQKRFDDLDSVREFIEQNPRRYVLKLDQTVRDAGETLVAVDPKGEDLLTGIKKLETKLDFAAGSIGFYLQEFVEGTEVSIGGFFNGKKIIGDRLLVSFDASGGFCYDLRIDGSALVNKSALEIVLSEFNYRGPFDINGMLTKEGKFVYLEWTPRWGSGMTEFFCHSVADMGKLLRSIATGEDTKLLEDSIEGKVVLLVNSRDEELEDAILDVVLEKGGKLPYISGNASFWVDNASMTNDGRWVVLPVQKDEHRKGRYVAHAATLEEAVEEIDAISSKVKIAECFVDTARAYKELDKRVKTIYGHIKG